MNGLISARVLLPVALLAAIVLATVAVLDRMTQDGRAAERRALLARDAELTAQALTPGSALACLGGFAGEAVESACEASVFADAQSAARAVAYMGARITLLWDAHALAEAGGADLDEELAATRRAVGLDRFGIAAQVLSNRDNCTADACDAFALVEDDGALKANIKARVFEQYVSRHAERWNGQHSPADKAPAVSLAPAAPPVAGATSGEPVPSKWDFPSAASIPPVSIMNSEPPRPKEGDQPPSAQQPPAEGGAVPVPPRRPQPPQALEPPAR